MPSIINLDRLDTKLPSKEDASGLPVVPISNVWRITSAEDVLSEGAVASIEAHKKKLRKLKDEQLDAKAAVKDWWVIPENSDATETVLNDIKVLNMRRFLNPKQFVKSADSLEPSKRFHIGTIVDSGVGTGLPQVNLSNAKGSYRVSQRKRARGLASQQTGFAEEIADAAGVKSWKNKMFKFAHTGKME